MVNFILKTDQTLTGDINSFFPHNPLFQTFFSFFSLRGNAVIIWILIIVFLIVFEEKRDKKFLVYFTLSFLTTAFVVNIPLKNIFQRPRPKSSFFNQQVVKFNQSCPKDFSFPSGHASTAFTAAVVLTAFDKKRKKFYYLIASLIALSRIYLGCHYLLDVLAGGLIGFLIGKLYIRKLKANKG